MQTAPSVRSQPQLSHARDKLPAKKVPAAAPNMSAKRTFRFPMLKPVYMILQSPPKIKVNSRVPKPQHRTDRARGCARTQKQTTELFQCQYYLAFQVCPEYVRESARIASLACAIPKKRAAFDLTQHAMRSFAHFSRSGSFATSCYTL